MLSLQSPASSSPPKNPIVEALKFYIDHPAEWVEDTIGIKLDPWQSEVLQALATKRFVAVRSGHGVGKSYTTACSILWFLCTHPFCKVICTAPTKEQLYDVLWAHCAGLIRNSARLRQILEWGQEKIAVLSNPEEWFAVARTAEVRKVGKTGLAMAEGLQGRHADSILYVLDEASGIDEAIMNTVDGALTSPESYVLMTGNPTRSTGTFYDAFHTKRKMWAQFHIDAEHTPRVDPAWCDRMLEKYGSRDHPLYLIRVRGEFPPAQHNSVFNLNIIEECMHLSLDVSPFDFYEIGLDVARYGDNSTCFCIKHGPIIERIDQYSERSTMETAGRTIQYINKYRPIAVRMDSIGVGGGVYDRLKEQGFKEVFPINNGWSAKDDKQFLNLRAEAYWYLKTLLEQKRIQLPNDDDLIAEMTSITYKVSSRGKIQIESKEELRERGVKSPDRLDSLVLACMPNVNVVRKTRLAVVPFMQR